MAYDVFDPQTGERIPPQQVIVTDFDMAFGSMVKFMVKWAIAAIPALIILLIVGTVAGTAVVAMVSGAGR